MVCLEFVAGDAMSVNRESPAYLKGLNGGNIKFESHIAGGVGWAKIGWSIFRTVFSSAPDLVLSCEYRRAFLVNLALIMTRSRAPHIVLGMNLSAKPIVSRNRMLQGLIDRVFARSTAIVVHSTAEAKLFARLHNLPAERFAFSHWGFDLPADGVGHFNGEKKPYFCMIGRNNRDVDTFAEAIRKAGTRGIAILPSYLQLDPAIEQTLQVYRDLSMSDCVNCIRNAAANVTLLRDGSRGAGHITVVIAMHLGVPQIYSDTEVLQEYFPAPGFGLPVPVGDGSQVAKRMVELLEHAGDAEAHRLSTARQEFARAWLSHASSSSRISEVVLATLEGRRLALIDPDWQHWLEKAR